MKKSLFPLASISLLAVLPALADEALQIDIQPGVSALRKLVWQSRSDCSYNLWFSDDLQVWSPVNGYPRQGTGKAMEYLFPPASVGLRGYFRVTGAPGGGPAPEGFSLIPAGAIEMGDAFGEGWSHERPVHKVQVSAFYMQKTEVTKAQWDETYEWAVAHDYQFANPGEGKGTDHPVHSVNWYDMVKWCNARSERAGLAACYRVAGAIYRAGRSNDIVCDWEANGYRLPTEAEWEKAARGGLEGKRFPRGDRISHSEANFLNGGGEGYATGTTGFHPDYDKDNWPYTSPVGSLAPNGHGLHDMAGNVWEWCWDQYWHDYYSSSPATDPRGRDAGASRVLRGGSWINHARYARVSFRFNNWPDGRGNGLGFRLARSRL